MNNKWIATVIVAMGLAGTAVAQTEKEKPSKDKQKDESIVIRKKSDSKEKVTVVIDGDNITVNGKDIKDLKDGDIEVFRNQRSLATGPGLERLRELRTLRIPRNGMAPVFGGSGALLGVVSEKNEKGAKITEVSDASPAAKAGLLKDDIITKVNDIKIDDSNDLFEAVNKFKPDEKVTISYLRNGKESTATATLGKRTSDVRVFNFNGDGFNRNFNFDMPNLRIPEMGNMTFNRKPRLGLQIQDIENGKGVKVLDVDKDTPAAKAGIQKDDVITEIGGKPVTSTDDLRTKTRELKEGDNIKLTYQRNGKTQTTDISFPKKLRTVDL